MSASPPPRVHSYDVIISGAGPAGSTCALFLARAGHSVLLLDKERFPRDKICADNKTWKALDIVKELGLWNEFQKLPKAAILGVNVESPGGAGIYTPLFPRDIQEKGPWYNVKRLHFDALLARAAQREKKVTLREKCTVLSPLWEKDSVTGVAFQNEKGNVEHAYARVIVGADGSLSPIAQAVGVPAHVNGRFAMNIRAYFTGVKGPMDRCELYYLKGVCPGYFWIFPVDETTCNVGVGMRPEEIEKSGKTLEQWIQEILRSPRFCDRFSEAHQQSEWKSWGISVLGSRRRCAGNGWVLIGDAGTFALTFSGEGCGPGMRTGKIAAQSIHWVLNNGTEKTGGLIAYEEAVWKILEPEVKGFRWLEFLLLHPRVYDWVVRRTLRNPDLLEISSRMQNDYSLSSALISPRTLVALLFPKKNH